jgi:hypothetical protein
MKFDIIIETYIFRQHKAQKNDKQDSCAASNTGTGSNRINRIGQDKQAASNTGRGLTG